MSDAFDVLPAGEMRAKYGLTAEDRPMVILDAGKVPAESRHLIRLAERFGVSDDLIRQDIQARTTTGELEAMRQAVRPHEDAFDEGLSPVVEPGHRGSLVCESVAEAHGR